MRSHREGGGSAVTQVKVLSPEIHMIARGQGLHSPEASRAAGVIGEPEGRVPGSESAAGQPTVHIGTWESRTAPDGSLRQAEEARRRYGGAAVGLTHSRGVGGATPAAFREPGTLEGAGRRTQRDEEASAIH